MFPIPKRDMNEEVNENVSPTATRVRILNIT